MSYARNHRDDNEPELVKKALEVGAHWVEAGPLDGWVGWRGRWYPCEIKNVDGRNRFQEVQLSFIKQVTLRGLPVWVWRNAQDVYSSLGVRITA